MLAVSPGPATQDSGAGCPRKAHSPSHDGRSQAAVSPCRETFPTRSRGEGWGQQTNEVDCHRLSIPNPRPNRRLRTRPPIPRTDRLGQWPAEPTTVRPKPSALFNHLCFCIRIKINSNVMVLLLRTLVLEVPLHYLGPY